MLKKETTQNDWLVIAVLGCVPVLDVRSGKQLIQSLVLAGFQGPGVGHTRALWKDGPVMVGSTGSCKISSHAISSSESFWGANMQETGTNLQKRNMTHF